MSRSTAEGELCIRVATKQERPENAEDQSLDQEGTGEPKEVSPDKVT